MRGHPDLAALHIAHHVQTNERSTKRTGRTDLTTTGTAFSRTGDRELALVLRELAEARLELARRDRMKAFVFAPSPSAMMH